jgi:energy-converting hydrogenase Eha subunit E
MDYREHLIRPLSRHFVDQLVQEIFINPADSKIIYQLIFDREVKVAWRAAWACQKITEVHPEWFSDAQFNELASLAISTVHGGLQRGCLSTLLNLPIPNSIQVEFINACFEWMVSLKSPIAVQAVSMKILYRICCIEPDFKPELRACLENVEASAYSAGFNSTRKNVLNLLINK